MEQTSHQRSKTQHSQHQSTKQTKRSEIQTTQMRNSISSYLQPARELPTKQYSLAPDMIGGWKPKSQNKNKPPAIIPLTYEDQKRDQLLKYYLLYKAQPREKIVFLGPLKFNSIELHQGKMYPAPLKNEKAFNNLDNNFEKNRSIRNKIPKNIISLICPIKFDSDFEGGNLDLVLQKSKNQYDLFMRVDTNTRGHTNWYYFQISNYEVQGTIKLNICNFRRSVSLYQKGLKPFIKSQKGEGDWCQQGNNIKYSKNRSTYSFLSAEQTNQILNKYFILSFEYQFKYTNDKVRFCYGVPYLYSQLLKFVQDLKEIEVLPSLKSLSGLSIPVLRVSEENKSDSGKKVVLITGRVHPGESNSSYVMQGILNQLCNKTSPLSAQLKQKYIFYIIPMLNPDGVVAGNYRTSLFGKDLNRTYNESRRYAFPQTYYLLQFAQKLKQNYKNKFTLFIDLHGHSSKKNVFMYGPQFSIQTVNYELSRQLPRIMSNLTNFFRYYSCSFRISDSKESTARGIFNKVLNIPFTYTLQTSNGLFFDSESQIQSLGNKHLWREIGFQLCKALNTLKLEKPKLIKRILAEKKIYKLSEQKYEEELTKKQEQNGIADGDSDIDPIQQDLPEQFHNKLQSSLAQQNKEKEQQPKKVYHFQKTKTPATSLYKQLKTTQPKANLRSKIKINEFNMELRQSFQAKKTRQFILPPLSHPNINEIFQSRNKNKQQTLKRQRDNQKSRLNTQLQSKLQKKLSPTIVVHDSFQSPIYYKFSRSQSIRKESGDFMSLLQKFKTIK